jgi:hypothetical protein
MATFQASSTLQTSTSRPGHIAAIRRATCRTTPTSMCDGKELRNRKAGAGLSEAIAWQGKDTSQAETGLSSTSSSEGQM